MKEQGEEFDREIQEEELDAPSVTQDGVDAEEAPAEETPDEVTETALSPIKEFTKNEGVETHPNITFREIIGGDILTNGWIKRQMGLILLCAFFAIIYITNRYSSEQEMIEIEKLKTDLADMRYRALTRSGELTVKTRQSQIEQSLRPTADSILESPKEPPFIIKSNRKEE